MYPLLTLGGIDLDPDLVRQLPRRLAFYHLAIPIAADDDSITVALAQPENRLAVGVVTTALGKPITPVRSPPDEIRAALYRVWQPGDRAADAHVRRVVVWSDHPARAADAHEAAQFAAPAMGWPIAPLDEISLEDLLGDAAISAPGLIAAAVDDQTRLASLLQQSPAPLWIARGSATPPRAILFVLRGHVPDRQVVDWVIRLAAAGRAQVTVLAAVPPPAADAHGNPLESEFAALIAPAHPRGAAVAEIRGALAAAGIEGRFIVQQADLETAVVEALNGGAYDVIAIAVEAYGDFVLRVMAQTPAARAAYLLIKASEG